MTRSLRPGIALCAGGVLLIQFLLQPGAVYPGDPNVVRAEASYLVSHGRLGIPVAALPQLDVFDMVKDAKPDQYFWRNQKSDTYFSRWGVTNTLAFAVPIVFARLCTPPVALLTVLNIYNAALMALLVAALLIACARQGVSPLASAVFTLAWVYASFFLYYARAQSAEIVQCTIAAWTFVAFSELNGRLDREPEVVRPAVFMSLLLAALMFAKMQFVLLWGLALASTFYGRSLRDPRVRVAGAIFSGLFIAGVAGQLALNAYKFGGLLETGKLGYPFPHETVGWGFTIREYARSIPDFLWGRDGSVLYHVPLFLFVLLGARRALVRNPRESVYLWGGLLLSLLVAGALINHNGGWAFGPRYLVQSLVPFGVLGAAGFARLLDGARSPRRRAFVLLAFLVPSGFGLYVEAVVASSDPFAPQIVEATLEAPPLTPGIETYLKHVTRVQLLSDFRSLCDASAGPLAQLLLEKSQRMEKEKVDDMLRLIMNRCPLNFALAKRRIPAS